MASFDKYEKRRAVTKLSLYLCAMKPIFVIAVTLGIVFIILGLGLYFFMENATLGFFEIMLLCLGSAVFIGIFIIIICSPLTLRGVYQVTRQEVFCGFQFSMEMKNYYINKVRYSPMGWKYRASKTDSAFANWFLVIEMTRIIAFRRDYIVSLENQKETNYLLSQAVVLCADGKKRIVRSSAHSISELREWVSNS